MNTPSIKLTNSDSTPVSDTPSEALSDTKSPDMSAKIKQVESMWRSRAKNMQYGKKTSAAYRKAEVEFYCGAMAALGVTVPSWTICIMSGRNPTPDL